MIDLIITFSKCWDQSADVRPSADEVVTAIGANIVSIPASVPVKKEPPAKGNLFPLSIYCTFFALAN